MIRTMPSVSPLILQLEDAFARVRQRLQPAQQTLLDELLYDLKISTIQLQHEGYAPTLEFMLLTRLLAQYKDLKRLWEEVRELKWNAKGSPRLPREAHPSRSVTVDPGFGFDDNPRD